MENHDTFNLTNVTDIENWIVVLAAMWKMFTFFWPVLVIAVIFAFAEHHRELRNENR